MGSPKHNALTVLNTKSQTLERCALLYSFHTVQEIIISNTTYKTAQKLVLLNSKFGRNPSLVYRNQYVQDTNTTHTKCATK